ncbi:hypothetical protein F4811DRAFT_574199 [Daldinia bambusicola]|nr:hypothetical protein F4811DRAFT_574199 [Daldinia bambusicola]
MSSPTQIADTPSPGSTVRCNAGAGQSAANLDNNLSTVVVQNTNSVYPLTGLSKLLDNEDTYNPEPKLTQYWKDHMSEYLEKVAKEAPASLATLTGDASQSQGSFCSNYVRQHIKVFGKSTNKNPYLSQIAEVPEPAPAPESENKGESINLEDFIDPSLIAQDNAKDKSQSTVREASARQEVNSSIKLPMTESFVNGIMKDIETIEPLLADQTWISMLDPRSHLFPPPEIVEMMNAASAPNMNAGALTGAAPYTQPAPYAGPAPYAQPSTYTAPVLPPAGQEFYQQPLPHMEPLSYMNPATYTGPASYPQTVPQMNPAFNTQPVPYPQPGLYPQLGPYPQQGMLGEPISYPQFGSPPPTAPFVQPVTYPHPASYPQPTPGVDVQPTFQPQLIPAQHVSPNFLAMPPPPPPAVYAPEREFTSHYFNNMSAVDYGLSTRQYLNQQVPFSTPPPATNPQCALPQSNAFPEYQVESPEGKGKSPCRQVGNIEDFRPAM